MGYDETKIQVRFNEVDAYQVAWHGHYVSWMEIGRTALAQRFGLDPFQLSQLGYKGPVVSLELKFLRPARFNDLIIIRTTLEPSEAATLVFLSEILGIDGNCLATGRTVHALTGTDGALQFRLPAVIAPLVEKLQDWCSGKTP